MSRDRDIARLIQRTPPAAIPPAYGLPVEDHPPTRAPLPYEVGLCRVIENLGNGSYTVSEIVWNGAYQLVAEGKGFLDETGHEINGVDNGEAGDEPWMYLWFRVSGGGTRRLILLSTHHTETWKWSQLVAGGTKNIQDVECDREGRILRLQDWGSVWHDPEDLF